MYKRMICVLLSMVLLFSLTGCNNKEKKEGEYQIYYMNMDRTRLVSEVYDSTGATGEELVQELLAKLQSAPDSIKLRQTIPVDIVVNSVKINGVYLYIDFNEAYKELSHTEEVLVRAAIVKTVMQTGDFSLVALIPIRY